MASSPLRSRVRTILILTVFIAAALLVLFFYLKREFGSGRTEISEDVMVEKITSMGKLELVKYSMKDVLEKKELRLILPDKRILLVAAGEVAGCIDLTRVKKEDIVSSADDSITVTLPQPEICYFKIDHKRSRVYDVAGTWFPTDTKAMVEDVYKLAEQRMLENAREMNIMGKTRENALVIFKPFMENISGKKVGIVFK